MTEDLEIETKGEVPVEQPAEDISEVTDNIDELLPKSTVSKIVARERQKADAKAYERGKREALMQLQQEQMQQQVQAQPSSIGGMQQLSQADIEKLIADRTSQVLQENIQQHVTQLQNKQLVDSFVSKMQAAEQKYPGLEKQLSELDYESMTPLIKMANDMENTGDIMKELIDNPSKMGNMLTLLYTQPNMAKRAMNELSNSIKQNEAAKAEEAQARDPMSQLRPSSSAGMESGPMSVNDFRKMFSKRR